MRLNNLAKISQTGSLSIFFNNLRTDDDFIYLCCLELKAISRAGEA